MPFYEVTLKRSLIGLPNKTALIAKSLGLKRVGNIIHHEITQPTAGKLLHLKELVSVNIVEEKLDKTAINAARKSDPGFTVIKQDKNVNI